MLVLPLVFMSCGSEDDDTPPSLKGSVWTATQSSVDYTLTFGELDATMILSTDNDGLSAKYSYTYDDTKVTLFPGDASKAKLEGIINNNTMTLVNTSSGKTVVTLTKR